MANEFKVKKGLIVTGASGGTVVDIQGSQGQLFSVTDNLSGSIFAVSDISGVPILDINSNGVSYFTGPIGIGVPSPSTPYYLQMTSGAGANGDCILGIFADADGTTTQSSPKIVMGKNGNANFFVVEMDDNHRTSFANAVGHYFQSGYVGIGMTAPLQPLSIENSSSPLIKIRNTTNGGGAAIEFNDNAASAANQNGRISYYHSDSTSQGGGSSFWLTGENDQTLVLANNGRVVVQKSGSTTEVGYGFYDDINTGMYRVSADALGFATGGTRRLDMNSSGVRIGTGSRVTTILDQDDMSGDSATALATQQSIKAYVDNAIAGVPQGDITAVTAGTFLTGGGTSGAVTLNADASKLAHIVDSSSGSAAAGWITVAQASDSRKAGEIYVTDGDSSDHSYIRIEWMRSYQDSNFTVLNCGGHANRIQGVRVLEETADTTYGKKYIQVKVTVASTYYVIVTAPGTIPAYGDFTAETPVLENSKTGYNIKGNTLEDLQNSSIGSEQGITSGGNIELNDARYVFTKGDVLSLSAGGAGSGTEIEVDDAESIIKIKSDLITTGEVTMSSAVTNGDDVFRANPALGTFTLGDIEEVGDGALIQSDTSVIKLANTGVDSLTADSSNNVSIPNGNLVVSGSTTANSLVKDGGTSSQFLKADGSVDSNTYLTTETGARMIQFNRSGINASTYTMLATVNGNNLASILKMTMTGTSGNVVFACTFDITVNHSQDIHVKSSNGDYTEVTLRITSDNNEDFSIEAKHNGSTTTTAEVCIYPLADEIVTPTTTDPGYTGAEYEHTATEGWRYGGEDGNVESSNVIVDGKIGIGTTSPATELEVDGDIGIGRIAGGYTFRESVGGAERASIKSNSTNELIFSYGASDEAMRIDDSGNVGIGTTDPDYKLDVSAAARAHGVRIGRDFSITDRGTVRIDANGTGLPADVLFGHTAAADEGGWNGVYWSLSSRGTSDNGKFQLWRGSGHAAPYNSELRVLTALPNGNIGIGNDAPGVKLHVNGTVRSQAPTISDWAVLGYNSSGNAPSGLWFDNGDGELLLRDDSGNLNVRLRSDTSSYINGGNLGLGTTSPNLKLDVISGTNNGIRISATDTTSNWRDIDIRSYVSQAQADALPDGSAIYTTNPTSQTETAFSKYGGLVLQGRDDGNSSFAIRLGNGGGYATRMFMGATGATVFSNTVTATNFILSSDERLKENVKKVCDNRVKADWKTFELKTDKGQKRYGVIAQELEKSHPEFVNTDTEGFKSVKYIDLLIAKIAELEARLEKLEK